MINNIIVFALCVGIIFISGTSVFAQSKVKNRKQVIKKALNIRISVTERGYQPTSFRLKKGIPARITFIRKTEDECGKEIVIPAYNIRRKLPLNTPVTVNFTPRKAGSFSFVCGMNMMRGKVIVQ